MKITVVGTGYVGLVSGVCFSEFGFDVTCVDVDATKIASLSAGMVPIYEPGLEEMMQRNVEEGRLSFTTDLAAAVAAASVVFIAVGTPSRRGDGEADLSYVYAAAREIARNMQPETVVTIKSTVVVGTCRAVRDIIAAERPGVPFSVASNPEFLREGAAIEDFLRPDRVVVGVDDERAKLRMRRVYRPLNLRETPILITSFENAELIKYAANAFLAMKVTFINEVADLCEKVGGNVQEIARGIGLDNRIGSKFLHAGPGFGGSCFPKDTRAFAATGRKAGAPQRLIEEVIAINEARKADMAARVLAALPEPAKSTVAVLGVAFKPNTDDVREAPSLAVIGDLLAEGVSVRAHDPEAMAQAAPLLPGVAWCDSPYQAAEGADVLVILTEWNAYRMLNFATLKTVMAGRLILDLRNIYKPDDIAGTGFSYRSVGRPTLEG
ncbi:UDP-glucose dehydrogenase family protein [Methylobrevis albus]|uniref:UDP-glucose 6-dehydrogenase n=1 Tax=Methylobrevis albus TaxID=2793297 RepID=A0A931I3H1_9HYPH|nr:UDP-glucose/GDP-mannose dehydrogenase family protein [Methylobrevis albus]MBH0238744.1 UDP-glucose/GDP-mannose dehydrogenase family protein [Methylobrevis albus]